MFMVADAVSNNGIPRIVLTGDAVVLELEWLAEIIAALPSDASIEMSGDGVTTQTVSLSGLGPEDGFVRVRFGGLCRGQTVTLKAKTGDRELVFATDHVASDLENELVWLHALDELIEDAPPPSDASGSTAEDGTALTADGGSQRTIDV